MDGWEVAAVAVGGTALTVDGCGELMAVGSTGTCVFGVSVLLFGSLLVCMSSSAMRACPF